MLYQYHNICKCIISPHLMLCNQCHSPKILHKVISFRLNGKHLDRAVHNGTIVSYLTAVTEFLVFYVLNVNAGHSGPIRFTNMNFFTFALLKDNRVSFYCQFHL